MASNVVSAWIILFILPTACWLRTHGQVTTVTGPTRAAPGRAVSLRCQMPASLVARGEMPVWTRGGRQVYPPLPGLSYDDNVQVFTYIRNDGVLVSTVNIAQVGAGHAGTWLCHPSQTLPHTLAVGSSTPVVSDSCEELYKAGDCAFFTCLEAQHPCGRAGLPSFALDTGKPLCERFERHAGKFNGAGKYFLNGTMDCLMSGLRENFLVGRPHEAGDEGLVCVKIAEDGLARRTQCAIQHGLCHVGVALNLWGLVSVFDSAEMANMLQFIPSAYEVFTECRRRSVAAMWNNMLSLMGLSDDPPSPSQSPAQSSSSVPWWTNPFAWWINPSPSSSRQSTSPGSQRRWPLVPWMGTGHRQRLFIPSVMSAKADRPVSDPAAGLSDGLGTSDVLPVKRTGKTASAGGVVKPVFEPDRNGNIWDQEHARENGPK